MGSNLWKEEIACSKLKRLKEDHEKYWNRKKFCATAVESSNERGNYGKGREANNTRSQRTQGS